MLPAASAWRCRRSACASPSRAGSSPHDRSSRSISASPYWAVVDVTHLETARPAEHLVPDVKGGADRRARVVRGRLDVHVFEWRPIEDHPVGDAVQRDPAGQTNPFQPCSVVDRVEQGEITLLEHELNRSGEVGVPRLGLGARPGAGPNTSTIFFE